MSNEKTFVDLLKEEIEQAIDREKFEVLKELLYMFEHPHQENQEPVSVKVTWTDGNGNTNTMTLHEGHTAFLMPGVMVAIQ